MVRFHFDEQKKERNRAKHGIDFETAQIVFDDPSCISFIECEGEGRWQAIGAIEDILLLVVVHTYREEEGDEVASSLRFAPRAMKGNFIRKLSAEKRRELQTLAKCPDSEIDLWVIPEIREIPGDTVIGRFYRPKKASVTIRLDADVLAWLKAPGGGYQTRISDYLRSLMRQKHRS